MLDRVAHRAAQHGARGAQAAGALGGHPRRRGQRQHDPEHGKAGRQRGQPQRAGPVQGQHGAGQRERAEEDGVDDHEEGQQRSGGVARAHARAAQRPQRHRGAAGARGGEQPGRGGAAERDLRALAQADPLRDAAADQPQQGDVAREREQLERGRRPDPHRVGGERASHRVRERVQRPAEDQQRSDHRGGSSDGDCRPARQRAEVERGEREVLGGHEPSIERALSRRIRDITSIRVRPPAGTRAANRRTRAARPRRCRRCAASPRPGRRGAISRAAWPGRCAGSRGRRAARRRSSPRLDSVHR